MELKLKASVEKERIKVQRAEVDLKRDETRKRKSIELKDQEFDQKKALQSHRFKCMSKVHSQKEILKKKTHKERMDTSASRLIRAQQIQNAPGTFPGIGGGDGSIERAVQWYSRQTQLKEPTVFLGVLSSPNVHKFGSVRTGHRGFDDDITDRPTCVGSTPTWYKIKSAWC